MASGFFIQAIISIIVGALAPQIITNCFPVFVIMYGFLLFFGEFGPGDCTILVSAEMDRGIMYGLSVAIGKAGAAIGTQVFKPILSALTESLGDPLRAQGYHFIIGSFIGILGGILTLLYIPNMTDESIDRLDVEFGQMLLDNGYDVN